MQRNQVVESCMSVKTEQQLNNRHIKRPNRDHVRGPQAYDDVADVLLYAFLMVQIKRLVIQQQQCYSAMAAVSRLTEQFLVAIQSH